MLASLDLQSLVASSRDPALTRDLLQQLPEVANSALQLLHNIREGNAGNAEETQEALLLCYRIMRNAAASGPATCTTLLHLDLLGIVRATLDHISSAAISLNWKLPVAVGQTLANLCNACCDSAAAAWAALFPLHLGMLAHVNEGATQAATCLMLLACCKAVPGAAASLVGPQGVLITTALLCTQHRMLQQGEHNDNLGLLLVQLCLSQDLLPNLFQAVGTEPISNGGGSSGSSDIDCTLTQPTMAQASLLAVLCTEAHDMPDAIASDAAAGETPAAAASMRFLVRLAEWLALLSAQQLLSQAQQQVLQHTLHLMRDICARDDSGRGMCGGGDLVASLQDAGFLSTLLALLKALGPIQRPPHQQQAAASAPPPAHDNSGIPVAELAPALAQQAKGFPADPPYQGWRTDLLAAVANAAHDRPAVQAEVSALGGVELVLAQCQVDYQSPLAREWALWGVRNLCEGNVQAQEAIRQLQLCTTVDSEEMQGLGVRLQLDEQTGKLRVAKREDDGGAGTAAGVL